MRFYTVHAPPVRADEAEPDPMRYVFVKEGFCWPALFIPELWLLFRRMWLVFFIFLAISLVLVAIGERSGGPLPLATLVLLHFGFALEANQLRRWTLGRRGYRLIGVAEGGDLYDAEMRYFLDDQRSGARTTPPPSPPPVPRTQPATPSEPSAEAGDVVGLFPTAGGTR